MRIPPPHYLGHQQIIASADRPEILAALVRQQELLDAASRRSTAMPGRVRRRFRRNP